TCLVGQACDLSAHMSTDSCGNATDCTVRLNENTYGTIDGTIDFTVKPFIATEPNGNCGQNCELMTVPLTVDGHFTVSNCDEWALLRPGCLPITDSAFTFDVTGLGAMTVDIFDMGGELGIDLPNGGGFTWTGGERYVKCRFYVVGGAGIPRAAHRAA